MSPPSNRKPALGQLSTLKKRNTSMSCKIEPAIWSRDTGQRITCFDRCQLIITSISNVKEVHDKPKLYVFGRHVARLRRRRRLGRAYAPTSNTASIAMITMRKSTHGFPFLSYMCTGLRFAALWAAGALLLNYSVY